MKTSLQKDLFHFPQASKAEACFNILLQTPPSNQEPFQDPSESFAHLFARCQGHAWSMQGGAAVAVQCTFIVILTLYSVWISQQVFIYL